MVYEAAEKRPSASLSGPLTFSWACKELLLTRRNSTPHPSSLRRTTKYASLLRIACLTGREKPRAPCIWTFLSSLTQMAFSAT